MKGRGLIERVQPRTRVVATFAAVFAITAIRSPFVLAIGLACALVLVWLSRTTWAELRQRLRHVEGFMLVLLIVLPVTIPGEPVLQLGPLVATNAGIARAASIVIKVNICSLLAFAVLGSLDLVQIAQAAHRLRVPPKLLNLFLFTARYVSVLRAETSRLVEAMRVRAFVPGSNAHCWRTYGNLAGTMLVRSLERAHRVDEAMRCRGFTGHIPAEAEVPIAKHDLAFVSVFAGAMVGLLIMDHFV